MKFYKTKSGAVLAQTDPRLIEVTDLEEVIPNTVDAAVEKHVPIIEPDGEGVIVKVGSVPHPMEEVHYIMWIEVECQDELQRKYLNPGEEPQARFDLPVEGLTANIYCNIHGLWKSE
jgi:superoxide reductase